MPADHPTDEDDLATRLLQPVDGDPAEPARVFRLEDARGMGPVPPSKFSPSVHCAAIGDLLRDLKYPPWLRGLVGRRSPASADTRKEDWVFGTADLGDVRDYSSSWIGRGCALSVYDVPRALLVVGDSEVMFWRGDAQGQRHPSGLAPELLHRIPEATLVRLLELSPGSGVE